MPILVALLFSLLSAACAQPERHTQLLVWVHADPVLAARLQQVRVSVYANTETDDGPARRKASFDIAHGERKTHEQPIPFSFSILPGENYGIELVIRGYDSRDPNAQAIAEQRTNASFLPRRTIELNLTLREITQPCAADAACAEPAGPMPDDAMQIVPPPMEHESGVTIEHDAGPAPVRCEKGPGADICDPIAHCGCNAPAFCKVDDDHGSCAAAGQRAAAEPCTRNGECAEGLACAWGACRSACRVQADCRSDGSKTAECLRRSGLHFGFCAEPCGAPAAPSCSQGLSCSPLELGAITNSFCLHVAEPCTSTDDGVCDEAGHGTGFCAANSDVNDCCTKPRPLGQCDIITQCGCPKEQACRVVGRVTDTADTACGEAGTRPIGARCDTDAQCVRGADCAGSICKRLCNDTEAGRCASGSCVPLRFDSQNLVDAGSCWIECEWDSQAPCMPGTVCAQLGTGLTCFVQPAVCPKDRLNDHVCDEATRACALGTDADDCAS